MCKEFHKRSPGQKHQAVHAKTFHYCIFVLEKHISGNYLTLLVSRTDRWSAFLYLSLESRRLPEVWDRRTGGMLISLPSVKKQIYAYACFF